MSIKVLVVDDSFFMRDAISKILESGGIEIIGTASNGKEAIKKVYELKPDIVTMDIEMPVMTGLDALKEIMKEHPVPVLMLSTLTTDGAEATVEALSLGAVDFIAKRPAFREMSALKDEIIGKVKEIASNSDLKNEFTRKRLLRKMQKSTADSVPAKRDSVLNSHFNKELPKSAYDTNLLSRKKPLPHDIKIICIGISTGGPAALQSFLKEMPARIPVPVLIAQHMPPMFTASLAKRLNSSSQLTVKEAEDNERLLPGVVYIAQGGKHMTINKALRISISDDNPEFLYKPSVDFLFNSVSAVYPSETVAVIMTGMGNDGTKGAQKLSEGGSYIIVQEPATCVVAGMPKSALDSGIVNEIVTLNDIPEYLSYLFGLHSINH